MPKKNAVITFSPRNFRKRMLSILRTDYPKFYDKFVKEISEEAVKTMKSKVPVRSGTMRNSISVTAKRLSGGRVSRKSNFSVGPSVFYARYVDKGTKESSGRFVPQLGRRIQTGTHPGIGPRDFTGATARAMIPKLDDFYKKHQIRPLKKRWGSIKPRSGQ